MTLTFTADIAPDMHERIMDEIATIEREHDVRMIFAIESGSRAWGFPSPDSDYDVRFVYARPLDWYLSLTPGRDVIEKPIDGLLDINGWDIKKALGLMLKANPVTFEWLSSPIRYRWNEATCAKLIEFSTHIAHGPACLHHYLHLGKRQYDLYIQGKTAVNLKKYFYVVRPAMAIRWMRLHPEVIPPMNFQTLANGLDLPAALITALSDLLHAKSRSKELGKGPRVEIIDSFIESEFNWAQDAVKNISRQRKDIAPDADALFREIIKR